MLHYPTMVIPFLHRFQLYIIIQQTAIQQKTGDICTQAFHRHLTCNVTERLSFKVADQNYQYTTLKVDKISTA